jgi:hypothetical protein
LAFFRASKILANSNFPLIAALYGIGTMRLILALIVLTSFLSHSNESKGTEFSFFDGTIKIPTNTSIMPIGDFGFIFKVGSNNLFSYERSLPKFFNAKHVEVGEINKIIKLECGLEIIERYFADTDEQEVKFTAHFRKPHNPSFMATVISTKSNEFYLGILKQYCDSRANAI